MLKVYSGNRLLNLLELMDSNIRSDGSAPLAKVPVCIQTPGMQRWIGLSMARISGVSANLDFVFPGALMKRLAGVGAREQAPWPEKQELVWRIFDRLQALPESPVYSSIRAYLEDDAGCIKSYRLSRRIADIFDQYQIYRPEMVLDWLSKKPKLLPDEDNLWQPELFRLLFPDVKKCKTYAFDRFIRSKGAYKGGTIHIFGVSVLPRFFIDMLKAASHSGDVCLYLLNPSAEYWGDSKTLRQKRRIERKERKSSDELYLSENHELLDNLGTTGRDFFDYIQGSDDPFTEEEHFFDIERKSVLTGIQADILRLENGGETYQKDSSVIINSCHNPLREAEALYDQLLELFDSDSTLKPSDILVMTPDIEKYSPYIKAVFDNPYSGREQIPFSIADIGERHTNRPAGVFLELIEAVRGDFSLSDVFRLLSSPLVSESFGLSQSDLPALSGVMERTGAFWGYSREHLAQNGLDTDGLFTWERALRRTALGLAEGDTGAVYADAAGMNIPFSMAPQIGGLMKLADLSSSYAAKLEEQRTAADWCATLSDMAGDFLSPSYDQADDMLYLERCIADIVKETEGFSGLIPFEPVYERIKETLSETRGAKGFISGRVTFCAMLPMRSIPFRVICIMGLNENTFPRQKVSLEFDLMAKHPLQGDRNNRDSDRYLFLETLVSAKEKLILSYTGQSERDNTELPPSALVTELTEHIKRRFGTEGLIRKHRLHSFSMHYFSGGGLFTYSPERYRAAQAISALKKGEVFAKEPVPSEEAAEVSLEDFERFFISPAGHFLRRVLGINPEISDESLPETEVLSMDTLRSYSYMNGAVTDSLAGGNPADTLEYLYSTAQLPPENLGRYHIDDIERRAAITCELAKSRLGGMPSEAEIDAEISGLRIKGKIGGVNGGRHVYIKPSSLKPKDIIRGWIRHLLLNNTVKTETYMIGSKGELVLPIAESEPLKALAELYKKGQKEPLRFHITDGIQTAVWKKKIAEYDGHSNMETDYACRICFGSGAQPDPDICRGVVEPIRKHIEGGE